MKKIMIIGCPGSGKSTFAKSLHKRTGIPLFHLDMLFWNKDKTTVETSIFLERLQQIFREDAWIIDGNYRSTMELRMRQCDTVMFLDYPLELCLNGIRERKGKPRSDMPWIESDEEDAEFVGFIKSYNSQCRPDVLKLLEKYPEKEIYVFSNRTQAEDFLNHIK